MDESAGNAPVIDYYNLCTAVLIPRRGELELGHATGFWFARDGQFYLVTNCHVVSGRNAYTGQPLRRDGAIPEVIRTFFQSPRLGFLTPGVIIPLYNDEGRPIWWQHASGQDIDVAIIPFDYEADDGYKIFPVNQQIEEPPLFFNVGIDVFVVGYPLNIQHGYMLPIWKRGTVATTPSFPFDGLPLFLIDTLSRKGMSGSPVFVRSIGGGLMDNMSYIASPAIFTRFVGVYSGRYGADDQFGAHLGRVWHRSVIDEIIQNPLPGSFEVR
jgi:hypothetical protein